MNLDGNDIAAPPEQLRTQVDGARHGRVAGVGGRERRVADGSCRHVHAASLLTVDPDDTSVVNPIVELEHVARRRGIVEGERLAEVGSRILLLGVSAIADGGMYAGHGVAKRCCPRVPRRIVERGGAPGGARQLPTVIVFPGAVVAEYFDGGAR